MKRGAHLARHREESFAFHAAAPDGDGGYVLLLDRPDADGFVRVRRWESPDYTAHAREERVRCDDLRERIERQRRAGWRFTAPPQRVLAWLEPE